MTFKGELRKLKKEALEGEKQKWRHRTRRTRNERKAIEKYIKDVLEAAAKEGESAGQIRIIYYPDRAFLEGEPIEIEKWDCIWFAIKHRLRFKIITNESFLCLNYVKFFL